MFVPADTPAGELPDVATVMMVGPWVTPAAARSWLGDVRGTVYDGGHFPVVRVDGGPVVMDAAQWFAGHAVTAAPETVERWWWWLVEQVRHAWRRNDPGALAGSPGTVGRDLWLRTIPGERAYPVLPDEMQSALRSMSGQGRIQVFAGVAGSPELVDGIYGADMRLAYAACLDGLPEGVPTRQPASWWEPGGRLARCKVRAVVTIPRSWRHVGLLPLPVADELGWSWPDEPGRTIEGWWDGCELELAERQGWKVRPVECIAWNGDCRPFRVWRDRLLHIIDMAAIEDREMGRAVRAAVRAMLLHTIGAMHGGTHRVTSQTAPDQVPAGARLLGRTDAGLVRWAWERPPRWPETIHPEWTTHIWARARRRLLMGPGGPGVLAVPRDRLLGVRTDAVYWSGGPDPFPVRSAVAPAGVGEWVRSHDDPRAQPRPRTNADLMRAIGVLS